MSDKNKKSINLTWDVFQSMGDPSQVPDDPQSLDLSFYKVPLKVHYEKKGRGGKEAVIIRGFGDDPLHNLDDICKTIKTKLGVGGGVKEGEIIIQGNQRDRVVDVLVGLGYKNIKKAGG